MVLNIFLRKVVDICTRRNSWTFNILLVSNQPIKHLKYLKKDVLVDTVPVTFSFKAKTRKRIKKYSTDTDNGPTGDKSTSRPTEPTSSSNATSREKIVSDDRLEIMDKLNSPYKFQLLFRGSRDGLSGEKFYEICDNQNRTVTIIKVKDGSEILGGYNKVEWRSDGSYGTTKDSIIFSFNNDDRIENYILSRVMNECYATDF
ncbi:hypothetical protein RhiirA5_427687 [Rhizophagus irregularis]|uniref:TLDc domain-containing protein n=1 Tax=Rhizophagus irregularis TaxID=588596 RepID=A0A2N0P1U2_9GLOM|nr:hypothetical protein RhiirA5_427687 [Rhizophagus irregularis]